MENTNKITDDQIQRANRSIATLKEHGVPIEKMPPLYIDDMSTAKIQSPQSVGIRTMLSWLLSSRATDRPVSEISQILDNLKIREHLTPLELKFISSEEPDQTTTEDMYWELERLHVLLWAMNSAPFLGWPRRMLTQDMIYAVYDKMMMHDGMPGFYTNAVQRSKEHIMDELDLMMKLCWVVRQAILTDGTLPDNLEWHEHANYIPAKQVVAGTLVFHRYQILSWIVSDLPINQWDQAEVST